MIRPSFILVLFLILSDGNGVFTHERGTGLQVVHVGLILELAVVAAMVAQTVPWFDTDKGRLLLVRTPEGDDRTAVVECHGWCAVGVEQDSL